MEKGNNDIKTYSAEDLARYWEGKMSPQEMHALEAAAMEDPFLADALEGYAAIKPAMAAADVDELRERLLDRTRDKKIIPIKRNNNWWRVAAILIFLGGASLLTYLLMQQNGSNQLAKKEANATATPNATSTAPALPADTLTAQNTEQFKLHDNSGAADIASTEATANKESEDVYRVNTAREPGINQQGNVTAAAKPSEDIAVPDLSAYKKNDNPSMNAAAGNRVSGDSLMIVQNNPKVADALQGRAAGIEMNQANARRNDNERAYNINNFSGRVVDQQNNAVPFASVRLNNSNQVASTNTEGYFQIKSPDSVLNLSINSVGYEPRQITIRGNEPQNVMLEAQQSKMKEVVVTGASTKKRSPARQESKLNVYVMDAQPVIGWDEYNKYLDSSKRNTGEAEASGEVVVSFWVNKRGQLSDFTIEKSLGKARDNEAIRLIKQGPAWKLMKGKKTRARVIVNF